MKRLGIMLVLSVPLACGEPNCPTTVTPGDASPPAAAATNSDGEAVGLSETVRDAATTAPKVERMKLRFDAAGALSKQAVYHDDAAAIPEAVRRLAEQQFPGAKVSGYETEHYADHGDLFEVELDTADGKHCEVAAQVDGTLFYTECRLETAELPGPVAERVSATVPAGTILEAERKMMADGGEEFTVEVELEGRELYLRIAADGALLSKHLRVPALVELPLD